MLTTIEIVDKVYAVLRAAGIQNVYKDAKPIGEDKASYVVINTLPINADILQECPVNVNVHVKDKNPEKRIADRDTLLDLSKDVIDELNDYLDSDIEIYLLSQAMIKEPDIPEHFNNLRFNVLHVE